MRTAGYFLLLLGAGFLILPMIGFHPALLEAFGEHKKYVPYAALVLGGILLGLSFRKKKAEKK